ncbi:hypothetical protein [Marinobacter sp.]|uniref:hypothetical protein n=1 Tax=Marinobacter sp. TaxID=50741 RepID=UPI003A9336BA
MAVEWTAKMDAALGSDTDRNIGGRFGLTSDQVGVRRRSLGIEAFKPIKQGWTPEEDAVLGTNTLAEVSALLVRPTSQIIKRMKELDIPPFMPSSKNKGRDPNCPTNIKEAEIAERNKAHHKEVLSEGLAVSFLVWKGATIIGASKELGITYDKARRRLHKFERMLRHPARLGRAVHNGEPASVIEEVARRVKMEIEHDDKSAWNEPWPQTGVTEK